MSEAPEVTVVVPTRDRWPLLSSNALPSALRQSDVSLELVVVDDGSSDGTAERLAALADPRMRVIRHESSRGVAAARNAGIRAARGAWVAFLDDDDLWAPHKLRAQLDEASEAGADVVYAAAVIVDEARNVLAADIFPSPDELEPRLLRSNVIPGGCSSVVARSALLREVGGFDERLTYTEDWELWIRLVRAGRVAACSEVLVAHVEHPANALFRYRPDVASESEYVISKHGGDLSAEAVRRRRRGMLEWLAHEYRRSGRSREAARASLAIAREWRSVPHFARALLELAGPRAKRLARVLARRSTATTALPEPEWLAAHRRP
jgi:glycosyltransferase involved in cell wall biosynthesis